MGFEYKRLGDILEIRSSSRVLVTDYKEEGVPFLSGGDLVKLDSGKFVEPKHFIMESLFNELKNQTGVPKFGDLLITANGTVGFPYIVDINEDFYFKDAIIWIKQNKKVCNKFVYYIYKSTIIAEQILLNSFGSTILNYNLNQARKNIVPLPELNVQQKIANFLDIETAKIDKEIELLEKKVELLNEYQQSLIFETVTKGIDKNVKMKNSGIEWIGEIPEHWEVKRGQNVFSKKEKVTGKNELPTISLSFGVVVLKKQEITEDTKSSYQEVKVNNILINPLNLNYDLKSLRIGISKIHGITSSGYIVIEAKKLQPDYLNYLMHYFDVNYMKQLGGGVRQTISFSELSKCLFVKPPVSEQFEIVNFLDQKISALKCKNNFLNKKIALLKEYKQSLIYEAVTGKLEIN